MVHVYASVVDKVLIMQNFAFDGKSVILNNYILDETKNVVFFCRFDELRRATSF